MNIRFWLRVVFVNGNDSGVAELTGCEQRTCALFLITVFILFVVFVSVFLVSSHFHAEKYEGEGGTFTVQP
jgi:hypothetical protein